MRPLGAGLSFEVPVTGSDTGPVTTYCEQTQVAHLDGVPAVESTQGPALLGKKTITAEDTQKYQDEVAR